MSTTVHGTLRCDTTTGQDRCPGEFTAPEGLAADTQELLRACARAAGWGHPQVGDTYGDTCPEHTP